MKIKTGSYPSLRQEALEVEHGADMSWLINIMIALVVSGRGVGLADNQVGELHRVIVICGGGITQEFINPVITKSFGGKHTAREGCLSFPGEEVLKIRDKRIIVEGFTRDWRPIKRKLKGLAARIVQHEIDHLNGINIVDKKKIAA